MYNLLKSLRLSLILLFICSLIFLFAKYLLLPIIIFMFITKFLGYFKFKKPINKKSNNNRDNDSKIIDAEYEDID